ncbi:CopG family protein [Turneriella parva DSM 21527]|uniref:CopG family protein n=2 Tax=Turneriella TaxID=338321 RepID=I4B9J8_TURPD|nr:CopG family protein [Turneriella parva DSM 21527]
MRNIRGKAKYTGAPKDMADAINSSEIVEDFLPKPEDLVFKKKTVKVTMNLSKDSVDFFKVRSRKLGVPYQKMINSLVDKYVERYGRA